MNVQRKIRVLFLCTGNSCRSQIAEAILRDLGGDRFEALSAGSHPAGYVHPLAVEAMRQMDISIDGQTSKSWNDFVGAPVDAVITVCDVAAGQTCPMFPGSPLRAHWSLPDPVYHAGTDEERLAFALLMANRLKSKIQAMVELDWSSPPQSLQKRLEFLGEI